MLKLLLKLMVFEELLRHIAVVGQAERPFPQSGRLGLLQPQGADTQIEKALPLAVVAREARQVRGDP